jgi:hypothetical protein
MRSVILTFVFVAGAASCLAKDPISEGSGGTQGTGGSVSTGGVTSKGGTIGTGGTKSTGGTTSSGGTTSTGGTTSSGGTSGPPPAVDCTDVSDDSSSVAAQFGTMSISLTNNPNKSYIMQANWWGTPYNAQSETLKALGFTIVNPSNTPSSNPSLPLGYPSIYIGSYSGRATKGSNLPKQVSALTSVPTTIATNVDQKGSASYNAAYDVWFTSGSAPLGKSDTNPGAGGAFLMVWLFMPSDKQPRGSIKVRAGTVDGVPGDWDVWYDNSTSQPPCVSYVAATKTPSLSFDLNDFIQHAIKNSLGVTSSQYLSIIFGGFEVWGGGDGVQLKQFCANVK